MHFYKKHHKLSFIRIRSFIAPRENRLFTANGPTKKIIIFIT